MEAPGEAKNVESGGKSMIRRTYGCLHSAFKGCKYFMILLFLEAAGLVLPFVIVNLWKPYEMYCLSRLDSYLEVPPWCMKTVPNLYSHIQAVYWDVGFLKFLERPWYLFATSLFTSGLFFYMLLRLITDGGIVSMLTFGLSRTYER